MARQCSMCNDTFYDMPSDILPGKSICAKCEAYVKSFVKGKSEVEKKSAEAYVRNCFKTTKDDATRIAIGALLQKYGTDNSISSHDQSCNSANEYPYDPKVKEYLENSSIYSVASGKLLPYVVIQVTLKEKLIGTGTENLDDLENVINHYAEMGYRLHTLSTACSDSKGLIGGDRIQATLVFEKVGLFS